MNLMRICSIYYKVLKTVRIIVVCQNIVFEHHAQKKMSYCEDTIDWIDVENNKLRLHLTVFTIMF